MAHVGAFAADGLQHGEALALEAVAGLQRPLVPGLAGLVLLETRSGIDDQQRAHSFRMGAIECQRHVAAEREPADDGAGRTDLVKQRGHVGDDSGLAVGGGIVGIVRAAMAAHVPQYQLVTSRQRLDLALPHLAGR